jgi:hypothetical protein
VRPERGNVVPWWEELDSEAFREFRAASIAEPQPPIGPFSPEPEADLRLERPVTWAPRAANGRRTVQITGRGTERSLPAARPTRRHEREGFARPTRRHEREGFARPALRRHEREGFKPDRAAMWAVVLGLVLILVAATSAHGAVVAHQLAAHALAHVPH